MSRFRLLGANPNPPLVNAPVAQVDRWEEGITPGRGERVRSSLHQARGRRVAGGVWHSSLSLTLRVPLKSSIKRFRSDSGREQGDASGIGRGGMTYGGMSGGRGATRRGGGGDRFRAGTNAGIVRPSQLCRVAHELLVGLDMCCAFRWGLGLT